MGFPSYTILLAASKPYVETEKENCVCANKWQKMQNHAIDRRAQNVYRNDEKDGFVKSEFDHRESGESAGAWSSP